MPKTKMRGGGMDSVVDKLTAYGVGVRAGAITPNVEDENLLRSELGLPPVSEPVRSAWGKEKIRRPITLVQAEGSGPAPAIPPRDEPEKDQ